MVGDLGKESIPEGRRGVGIVGNGRQTGDEVLRLLGIEFTCTQIDGTILDGEAEWVGIKGGREGGDTLFNTCKVDDGANARGGRRASDMFKEEFILASLLNWEGGHLLIEAQDSVFGGRGNEIGVVDVPTLAIPDEPSPGRDVANVVAMAGDEMVGVAQIGEVAGRVGKRLLVGRWVLEDVHREVLPRSVLRHMGVDVLQVRF